MSTKELKEISKSEALQIRWHNLLEQFADDFDINQNYRFGLIATNIDNPNETVIYTSMSIEQIENAIAAYKEKIEDSNE